MFAWYPSWLPGIPSMDFVLPSTLQRRFMSFVLKKSLGHLLKPGQLDANQIESQIGSGYVQVKDLELDSKAINSIMQDLPIKLHEGSISAVTARIPLPNPLTAKVGFSLRSLHLVFHLEPRQETYPAINSSLGDSVVSAAESFIHDELTHGDETNFMRSFHEDLAESIYADKQNLPGSMDPFLSDPDEQESRWDVDPAGISMFATLIERLLARFEFDAQDTQVSLVHPGNAVFTFAIPEIRYGTETSHGSATHGVTNRNIAPTDQESADPLHGEIRTLFVQGFQLSIRDLHSHSSPDLPSSTISRASPTPSSQPQEGVSLLLRSPSPASSSSSLDEQTQMLMSHSMAFLPPRPPSPAQSVGSSMYESATSTSSIFHSTHGLQAETPLISEPANLSDAVASPLLPQLSADDPTSPEDIDSNTMIESDVLLSFGVDPIVLRLITPRIVDVAPSYQSSETASSPSQPTRPLPTDNQRLQLTLNTDIIACALRAQHLRCIMRSVDDLRSHRYPPQRETKFVRPVEQQTPSFIRQGLDIAASIRGFVLLLLPSHPFPQNRDTATTTTFFRHPLGPPLFPTGCLRVHLDGLSVSGSFSPASDSHLPVHSKSTGSRGTASVISCTLALNDISIFALYNSTSADVPAEETALLTEPVLITDQNLPSQYSLSDLRSGTGIISDNRTSLTDFEVIDWTDKVHHTQGLKLSIWRTKMKQRVPTHNEDRNAAISSPRSEGPPEDRILSNKSSRKAIVANIRLVTSTSSVGKKDRDFVVQNMDVTTLPLHIFVDLGFSGGLLGFLGDVLEFGPSGVRTEVTPEASDSGSESDSGDDEGLITPRQRNIKEQEREKEKERKRLEKLVLDDLDLRFDYGVKQSAPKPKRRKRTSRKHRDDQSQPNWNVFLQVPIIRVQIRCPSPGRFSRSGALVFDFHGLTLANNSGRSRKPTTRFSTMETSGIPEDSAAPVLMTVQCQSIILACSEIGDGKAHAFLSLGPLSSPQDMTNPFFSGGQQEAHDFDTHSPLQPRVVVTKAQPERHYTHGTSQRPSILALCIDIPAIDAIFSKSRVDALQFWVDDVAQLLERISTDAWRDTESEKPGDSSIIGSRFFAKSRGGSVNGSALEVSKSQETSETAVKVAISEGAASKYLFQHLRSHSLRFPIRAAIVRFILPREQGYVTRPFDIRGSDIDILMEFKPDGRDESVYTLGVMDLNITETTHSGAELPHLNLTSARSLNSASRSAVTVRFTSLVVPETIARESKVQVSLHGVTYSVHPDLSWATDLGLFMKAPPGTFEAVVPSERTRLSVKVADSAIRILAPSHPGALVLYIGALHFTTDIIGESSESSFQLSLPSAAVLLIDNITSTSDSDHIIREATTTEGIVTWKDAGFALIAEFESGDLNFAKTGQPLSNRVAINRLGLQIHLCADTATALTAFIADVQSPYQAPENEKVVKARKGPTTISDESSKRGLSASIDEHAFKRNPEIGPAPDMIMDDLPSNLDYLDESFGTAAGLRELRDDDLDDFYLEEAAPPASFGVTSKVGGETIKIFRDDGIHIVEDHFDTIPPASVEENSNLGETALRVSVDSCDVGLLLYSGYDWVKTRKTIEEKIKEMRRRLAKLRQLLANGQTQERNIDEETSTLLFNSVYIGLDENVDDLEPDALIAVIDEELQNELETASQSSWQSLRPTRPGKPRARSSRVRGKRLTRSRGPSIEIRLSGVHAEIENYSPGESMVSRTFVTVKDLEILDHIKTSTWKKFLTELRSDSRGNVRETGSNMVRLELRMVQPVPDQACEEARLRVKVLPLRLYVDQDALDFLKAFFSFKDPHAAPTSSEDASDETYFQLAEIFPVDLKLDYKPRRVDYRALREGRTIELMNFFHFDGAEMTLRHITLSGVTGWAKLGDMLNDLWTPDVKATQLVEVISGVAPIRSIVNVGSGVADLVLLPIAQYKKDGRIVRGVQKGATAFVKSTATEAIKIGAHLATGTQVILEQVEGVFGDQFKDSITTETLQFPVAVPEGDWDDNEDPEDMISKYAEQPTGIREGFQSGYRSLRKNFNSAAQTILAVPMEVYERSGNEGAVRSVIRAVPIAVLRPMIGASEAISKTLQGAHNTLDPNVRLENEAKYKHR